MRRSALHLYDILGYKIDSQQRIDYRMEPHTLVPIICVSEVTFLTNFSGDKKTWTMYMTIGNILSRTRNNSSKYATGLLGLLPVPLKLLGVAARDARQSQVDNEILYDLMEVIFAQMAAWGTPDLSWNTTVKRSDYVFYTSQLGL